MDIPFRSAAIYSYWNQISQQEWRLAKNPLESAKSSHETVKNKHVATLDVQLESWRLRLRISWAHGQSTPRSWEWILCVTTRRFADMVAPCFTSDHPSSRLKRIGAVLRNPMRTTCSLRGLYERDHYSLFDHGEHVGSSDGLGFDMELNLWLVHPVSFNEYHYNTFEWRTHLQSISSLDTTVA